MSNKEVSPIASDRAEESVKISERVNVFLRANRIAILAVASLALAAVLVLGIASGIKQSGMTRSTIALETLEANFDSWNSSGDEDRAAKAREIIAEADALIARYPSLYAGLRSRLIKGRLLLDSKDYIGAEEAFLGIAKAGPKSHLAPVALANAASMAEERGDGEAAIAHLEKLIKEYSDSSVAHRAAFTIGRLNEAAKAYGAAMEAYAKLVAGGADNDWTKMARDRIIYLRSQGLAK